MGLVNSARPPNTELQAHAAEVPVADLGPGLVGVGHSIGKCGWVKSGFRGESRRKCKTRFAKFIKIVWVRFRTSRVVRNNF